MLNFNTSGLLVPDTKLSSSLNELETEFVSKIKSTERRSLFDKYINYSEELKKVCGSESLTQWINGSFVSKKSNPKDIDIVTFLNYEVVNSLGAILGPFNYPQSEDFYEVDAYIVVVYPESHKNRFYYISDLAYWTDQFTKTKRNNRGNKLSKGFLEITY
jgi:hypothetical protein